MGYDQYLELTFSKESVSDEDLMKLLAEAYPRLYERVTTTWDTEVEDENRVQHTYLGRKLYDEKGFLFTEFDPQEVSEKLECTIEIDYTGEEHEDAEKMTYDKGAIVAHEKLVWVNLVLSKCLKCGEKLDYEDSSYEDGAYIEQLVCPKCGTQYEEHFLSVKFKEVAQDVAAE